MIELRVIWSNFAEEMLDEIYEYYQIEASLEIAKKLVSSLIEATDILVANPHVGQIEELLIGREESYRYLVCNNYKIIYSVDIENRFVKIADVFDTRQNPVKMNRNR